MPIDLTDAIRDHQSDVIETAFDFDKPKGAWRIQRADGQYYQGYLNDRLGDVFIADGSAACPFGSQTAAQHWIDIRMGSATGRRLFQDCTPVCLAPLLEPGDHILCTACGSLHERDACPNAMAL